MTQESTTDGTFASPSDTSHTATNHAGTNHIDDTAITASAITAFSQDFRADRANRVAANADTSAGVLAAATSYAGARALPRDFSI